MSNDMQTLCARVRAELPDLENCIDIPSDPTDSWFLDILRPQNTELVVQWKPEKNFGLSSIEPGRDYHDEIYVETYDTVNEVFERIQELVKSGDRIYSYKDLRLRYKQTREERDRLLFLLWNIYHRDSRNFKLILKDFHETISDLNTKDPRYLHFLSALNERAYFK